ncbi:MAG: hypothetical protein R2751_16375 [Bacteroidales bacterium]
MKHKTTVRFALPVLISGLFLILLCPSCLVKKAAPALDNIVSLQAYTDLCFYGQKLTRVDITYRDRVDLSQVGPDSYVLMDRGYTTPDFAGLRIESVEVNEPVVTLHITEDTEALEDNALIYAGDDATGTRNKNPLGLMITGLWYRGADGAIYFGEEDSGEYKAKPNGEGYQTRESLELKLWHRGETEAEAACLAKADGSYQAGGLWLPTRHAKFGPGGFQTFEELGIQIPTTATDGEKFVRGWAFLPEGLDPNDRETLYPLVVSLPGYGTSFWRLPDGTNNFGTGPNFDGSAVRWMDSQAIVLYIQDRSHGGGDDYKFWIDDYHTLEYFIGNYNADPEAITLTGNSRGTMAISRIAQVYPDMIRSLLFINGSMGHGWTRVDWENAALAGTRLWAIDGEQDSNNIDSYRTAVQAYRAAGWSDEWIADNIRITGYPSQWFHYWGETDHLATKLTYWYFYDKPCQGPGARVVEGGELVYENPLNPGDTYRLKGRLTEGAYNKEGFDYLVYPDAVRDWVLRPVKSETNHP